MAAPNTTVSFTFDDGRPSQMAAAQQLNNRGMKATFFIISSQVGQPGVMSVGDLNTLKASGMEIGAHTVFHRNLQQLTSDEAKREVCSSRNWLMDRGFDVFSMAYPYDSTNASVEQLVAACGYNGARSGGQLQCDANHACSETVPPLDPYSIRTTMALETTTTLADMKAMVTNAENSGGGWVPLEIHDICDGPNDPLLPAGAPCYAPGMVNRALFNQFLDWVKGEVDAGRVQVKTVHEVVGGSLQPQVAMAPAPVRTGNLLLNPSFEQLGTGTTPADCWGNINNGPDAPPVLATTNDAHEGSKALTISVPAAYDSWAYNMIAPSLDLAQCAPTAVPGHDYTFSGWYKGNGQIKIVAYWRNADNFWQRLSWGPGGSATFPAAAGWTHASFSFAAPAGATAISAGFTVDGTGVVQMGGNSYTIDDTSLVDDDAAPLANYALAVSAAGAGTGTVTSNPAGIACGATCASDFVDGTSVTLTAAAAADSAFAGWSGACTGAATTCTVTMSQARSATATFTLLPVQLTVAKAGAGTGSVTSPAGIDCGATCQTTVANGTSVTLTAAAAGGSAFAGWSGACTGAATTCTVAMNAAKSATATFTLLPVQLTVSTTGTGSGAVTSPAGIDVRRGLPGHGRQRHERHAHRRPGARLGLHGLERCLHRRLHHLHRRDGRGQVGRGDVHRPQLRPHGRQGGHGHRHRHEQPGRHRLRRHLPGHAGPRHDGHAHGSPRRGLELRALERRLQHHGHDLHRPDERREVGHRDLRRERLPAERRQGGHGQRHAHEQPGRHRLRRHL